MKIKDIFIYNKKKKITIEPTTNGCWINGRHILIGVIDSSNGYFVIDYKEKTIVPYSYEGKLQEFRDGDLILRFVQNDFSISNKSDDFIICGIF